MQIGIIWTTGWLKMPLSTTDGAATAATSAAALNQTPRLYKTVSLNEIICIKQFTTKRPTRVSDLIDRRPSGHCAIDLDVLDLVRIHGMRVLREHHEVRQLPGRNGAFDRLLVRVVGAIERIDLQSFGDADALIRTPDLTVPTLAGDHALNGHEG